MRAVLLYLAKDSAARIIRCLSFLNSGSAPEKTEAACPVPVIPVSSLPYDSAVPRSGLSLSPSWE